MKIEETWRMIPGYGDMYEISFEGEVRSYRGGRWGRLKSPKILTPYLRKKGAKSKNRFVKLTDEKGHAHDVPVLNLIVDVWLGGRPAGKVAYHKNGDTSDSSVQNIGFITRKELGKKTGAEAKRKPVAKVSREGEQVAFYRSARAAAKVNHMSYQTVLDRCNGKVKKPFELDGHNYIFC